MTSKLKVERIPWTGATNYQAQLCNHKVGSLLGVTQPNTLFLV